MLRDKSFERSSLPFNRIDPCEMSFEILQMKSMVIVMTTWLMKVLLEFVCVYMFCVESNNACIPSCV
ncbi:hypothetical protein ANTQUA_LOCUS4402 [Anthophora quadrimaculata]